MAGVVLLHGIWMPATEMRFVKRHLEAQHGFDAHLFDYPSVLGTLNDNAERLRQFVTDLGVEPVHLVGHSLGGVIALRMLALHGNVPAGRVVCLGSPLCGSRVAEFWQRRDWGNLVLGKSLPDGVVHQAANEWAAHVTDTHDVGIIAGTLPKGTGRLVAKFDEPNDGTVAVSETRLPGAADHLTMAVSHTGMVVSKDVVEKTAVFLETGRFA